MWNLTNRLLLSPRIVSYSTRFPIINVVTTTNSKGGGDLSTANRPFYSNMVPMTTRWLSTTSSSSPVNTEVSIPPSTAPSLTVPLVRFSTNQPVGQVTLHEKLFNTPVRRDILHRVVRWQLAKRRQGTHKTKTRAEVSGSTRKIRPQKRTGRARAGSLRAPQFRHGGVAHGPRVRSHAIGLPKKVRKLGLRCALSLKLLQQRLTLVDQIDITSHKTKDLKAVLDQHGWHHCLIIGDRQDFSDQFKRALANLANRDYLLVDGANVYSILGRQRLILTMNALKSLEKRFE
jgi:large subunit ribosomal protein L4